MPEFRKVADVYQGYNFKKDKQSTVGFITKLNLGATTLVADQTCKDPTNPDQDVKVIAVLSDVLWETGVTDAIYFSGQLSVANRQAIAQLVYLSLDDVSALFQFSTYEYDPAAKKYFRCFHAGDTDLKGLLEKRGDELNLSVADGASVEVQSPENYAFNVGIKPQPLKQGLQLAVGDTQKFSKIWGLQVG
ncbi:MAG TPA: hypothetical protein VJV79_35325 [Polyangiaceae bacterium]|nr:hypothetical protein [Polyangiaceae bacterium]